MRGPGSSPTVRDDYPPPPSTRGGLLPRDSLPVGLTWGPCRVRRTR